MVIRDDSFDFDPPFKARKSVRPKDLFAADPFDRFAAQVIDVLVLFVPIYTLAVAPLKRKMTESYLLGDWGLLAQVLSTFIFVTFFVFIFSQVFSRLVFGSSLGKKILGLKVVDLWTGESPSLWTLLVRSIYIFIQLMLFGFPFLFVLTNRKHRGLHDQLSDTWVVNLHGERAPRFRIWPIQVFTRGLMVFSLLILVPVSIQAGSYLFVELDLKSVLTEGSSKESFGCQPSESLEQAMAYVATGYMETSCLKDYADIEFVEGSNPTALGYLAKSFLYVEEPDLSDLYLEKVCDVESGSPACVLAQFISGWSDGEVREVASVLEEAKDFKEPFLTLWALRYFQQVGLYSKSLEFSRGLTEDSKIGIFVKTQALKAKYLLGDKMGSDQDLRSMASTSDSPVVLDTMAWSCLKRVEQSCENRGNEFCQKVSESADRVSSSQPRILLARLRLQECTGKRLQLSEFKRLDRSTHWLNFIYALEKEQRQDFKSSWSLFEDLVKDSSTPDYLKSESIRRMSLHPDLLSVGSLEELIGEIETYEHRKESIDYAYSSLKLLKLDRVAQDLRDRYEREFDIGTTTSLRRPASLSKEVKGGSK